MESQSPTACGKPGKDKCLQHCALFKISGILKSFNLAMRIFTDYISRYERVKAVQKTGESTRDMWHKADWDAVKKNPKSVQMPREDWIHGHNAEKHAGEVFQKSFHKFATVNT